MIRTFDIALVRIVEKNQLILVRKQEYYSEISTKEAGVVKNTFNSTKVMASDETEQILGR